MADFILIDSPATAAIAGGCRALQYGDGLFTTMRVSQGEIALWPLHLTRLQFSAKQLGFAEPDWQQLAAWLHAQAQTQHADCVFKLLISRGIGGRGYAPDPEAQVSCYLYQAPLPDYSAVKATGLKVGVATLRLARQPALAGLKHCNRLEQVMLKRELAGAALDDLIVADSSDLVVEGTAANLFYQLAGHWYTPPLDACGVTGVMRKHIMSQLPYIRERELPLQELPAVTAMFFSNALLGMAAVRELVDRTLDLAAVRSIQQQVLC
jgi:4-amino-4-deoxychorismate lyase